MVMNTMSWLSGANSKATVINTRNPFCLDDKSSSSSHPTLGILSFETAKTMSRLIHLYKSLSNDEFSDLRGGAMKSQGVAFLISNDDEQFLLSLACAEKLEELNRAVNTVVRLGRKCTVVGLKWFDQTYAEMCLGIGTVDKLDYASKSVEKLVEKMEKYVKATSKLHSTLEFLAELEISEQKIKKWKQHLGGGGRHGTTTKANTDYLGEKITHHRKQVKHYKNVSLWNQTYDHSVGLMTRIIKIIFARICELFGSYVSDLPRHSKITKPMSTTRIRVHPDTNFMHFTSKSGSTQIAKSVRSPKSEDIFVGNKTPLNIRKSKSVIVQLPAESTVGGAGLAQRYANIIIYAEKYLHAPTCIDDEARGHLYDLLPESLKKTMRRKLGGHWRTRVYEGSGGHSLAEGWRVALEEMMTWLAPMAHDTVKWQQQERYLEKQRFDVKPTVMFFQTLYYADLEKTEVAIVEVLVGLSCIYRYENKRRPADGY